MTRHETGDRGQRYEIWCKDADGRDLQIGWSENPESFRDAVEKHPSWRDHRAVDRRSISRDPPSDVLGEVYRHSAENLRLDLEHAMLYGDPSVGQFSIRQDMISDGTITADHLVLGGATAGARVLDPSALAGQRYVGAIPAEGVIQSDFQRRTVRTGQSIAEASVVLWPRAENRTYRLGDLVTYRGHLMAVSSITHTAGNVRLELAGVVGEPARPQPQFRTVALVGRYATRSRAAADLGCDSRDRRVVTCQRDRDMERLRGTSSVAWVDCGASWRQRDTMEVSRHYGCREVTMDGAREILRQIPTRDGFTLLQDGD